MTMEIMDEKSNQIMWTIKHVQKLWWNLESRLVFIDLKPHHTKQQLELDFWIFKQFHKEKT